MVIWITKADGSREPFKVNKIKRTARRAGASPKFASTIVREVARNVYDGIPSRDVLKIIMRMLRQERPEIACRYSLKDALMRLGFAGFNFEQLMAEILKEYGYKTSTNQIVQGFCVQHEIDIIAEKSAGSAVDSGKGGETCLVECKYHNHPGAFTGLKETMYTWARLADIQRGAASRKSRSFDIAWLMTNTKFSTDSVKYSVCNNVRLLGWNYPKGNSLQDMIEKKGLFPVTVLALDPSQLAILAKERLLLLGDILRLTPLQLSRMINVSEKKAQGMQDISRRVINLH